MLLKALILPREFELGSIEKIVPVGCVETIGLSRGDKWSERNLRRFCPDTERWEFGKAQKS